MPFGLKQTVGILGHYSEAWAIASRLRAEACGDDADSRVSVENTNQNDCWQVRVRDLRELIRQTGSRTKLKYIYIDKEHVVRASVSRKRDGSAFKRSSGWSGSGR